MRIVVKTEQQFDAAITLIERQLQAHGERGLMLTVEPYRPPRTNAQNAAIHALVSQLADALGYTQSEMKEALKRECYPQTTIRLATAEVTVPKATSTLTREEASVVIEKILYLAAELGVTLYHDRRPR